MGVKKRIVEVEPLGTGIVLPAIVLGYEVTGSPDVIVRALPEGTPPWLWLVGQQAGGLSMTYPVLLGAILRLEANKDRGHDNGDFLIRGLKAMAEDPDVALLEREYPGLASLVNTHGEEYSSSSLEKLRSFLAGFFRLPPIASGLEAFIRFENCHMLDYFEGWKMLQHQLPERGVSRIYELDDDIVHVDESNIRELVLLENEMLSGRHLDVLRSWGTAASYAGDPSAFLLWENSD